MLQLWSFNRPPIKGMIVDSKYDESEESLMGFALSDLKLLSTAFQHGESIPAKHTGEAEDVSPQMSWSNVPEGYALIRCDLPRPRCTAHFPDWGLWLRALGPL